MHRVSPILAPLRSVVSCSVAGFGIVCGGAELLARLRRNPVPAPGEALAASFLKNAEAQTVAGLAAVYQAIYNFDLASIDQRHWGVIAAPTFLGRGGMADALERFAVEGAWGISPHLIPHQSLHAVSGTISQALRIHGPNFGVGGASGAATEALLAAASLLALPDLPGLWLVLTDHERELIPSDRGVLDANSKAEPEPDCRALAIALSPGTASSMGISMQLCARASSRADGPAPDWYTWDPLRNVGDLIGAFSHDGICQGNWRLGSTGWLRLQGADTRMETEF